MLREERDRPATFNIFYKVTSRGTSHLNVSLLAGLTAVIISCYLLNDLGWVLFELEASRAGFKL